jgi:cell division protein FtsX
MADDPLELETKILENTKRMEEIRRQLGELEDADMAENNPLQEELVERIEKQKQLNERWAKAVTGAVTGKEG